MKTVVIEWMKRHNIPDKGHEWTSISDGDDEHRPKYPFYKQYSMWCASCKLIITDDNSEKQITMMRQEDSCMNGIRRQLLNLLQSVL